MKMQSQRQAVEFLNENSAQYVTSFDQMEKIEVAFSALVEEGLTYPQYKELNAAFTGAVSSLGKSETAVRKMWSRLFASTGFDIPKSESKAASKSANQRAEALASLKGQGLAALEEAQAKVIAAGVPVDRTVVRAIKELNEELNAPQIKHDKEVREAVRNALREEALNWEALYNALQAGTFGKITVAKVEPVEPVEPAAPKTRSIQNPQGQS